jgi:ribonuclease BN (tRNA processing enzyme)
MATNRTNSTGNPVKVAILGTADAFSSGGRMQAGYLIDFGRALFLLEAGPAVLATLKKNAVSPAALDAIVVSHCHGDHFGGLPLMILDYMFESPLKRPIVVAGPKKLEPRTWSLMRTMFPRLDLRTIARKLQFLVLEPGKPRRIAGVRVSSIESGHMKPDVSLSLRFEFGHRTIVFSGDGGWNDELVRFSAGADLMLCECTYYESGHLRLHMNYPELRRNRDRFNVGRFVLVHLGREVLAHASEIDMEMAVEGMTIKL